MNHRIAQLASCLMLVISSFAPPEPPPPQPGKMDMSTDTPQQAPKPQQPEEATQS